MSEGKAARSRRSRSEDRAEEARDEAERRQGGEEPSQPKRGQSGGGEGRSRRSELELTLAIEERWPSRFPGGPTRIAQLHAVLGYVATIVSTGKMRLN